VKDARIEINIVGNEVAYDDFVIKAVIDDGKCKVESATGGEMTQVQTGPKEIILLILAVLLTGIILRRKSQNA